MLESSQVCILSTCFCIIQGILHVKECHSSCQRRCFSFSVLQDCGDLLSKWLWSVSLCAFLVPAIRRGWLWLGVLFIDVSTWCVTLCLPSQWGSVHMWGVGGHGLIKCADEKNSMPLGLEKQRLLWIHYFMVACQGVSCGLVARKQALGFNKAEQLLVCFCGTEWGREREGRCESVSWDLQGIEEGHLFPGTRNS